MSRSWNGGKKTCLESSIAILSLLVFLILTFAAKATTSPKGGVVTKCKCKSDFQDEQYGTGNRLHTVGSKKIRCTVCGKETATD